MTPTPSPICVRCHQPVTVNHDSYDAFEHMHWLCFHLEFEHLADPDEPCNDPSCPWWHIRVFRDALTRFGHEPQAILHQAIDERWLNKQDQLS
jgi:hypothetical protein